MHNKFIDTNIFIEIFARNGDKSERCKKVLQEGDFLCTSSLVLSEVEWVLRYAYELERDRIVIYMKKILSSDIRIDNKKLLIQALNFYEVNTVDWTDCFNMFLIKEKNVSSVYSYDKGLHKFGWIKRLEP